MNSKWLELGRFPVACAMKCPLHFWNCRSSQQTLDIQEELLWMKSSTRIRFNWMAESVLRYNHYYCRTNQNDKSTVCCNFVFHILWPLISVSAHRVIEILTVCVLCILNVAIRLALKLRYSISFIFTFIALSTQLSVYLCFLTLCYSLLFFNSITCLLLVTEDLLSAQNGTKI